MGYIVKRYVNDRLITEQELSSHTINNPVILDTIDDIIAKNNVRYRNNNNSSRMELER